MQRVLALVALLAMQAQSPFDAAQGKPPFDAAQGKPAFVDGLAQPVFAGQPIVRHNVWIEVPDLDSDRDGANDRIRVQISRPDATERGLRLPIVLVASPYSGGTRPYPQYDIHVPLFVPGTTPPAVIASAPPSATGGPYFGNEAPIRDITASGYQAYFLPRGFIFADANSLGTGHSTGCPTIGGKEENVAMKAVIDWFNGRGKAYAVDGKAVTAYWTTGATTMIGTSYVGTLPIGAASLGVDGLKAIVPIAGVSSYYDHRRSQGTVINSFPTIGTDADTLFDNILSRQHPEVCAFMKERLQRGMDRQTGDYNAFWDERNYVKDATRFKAAVLISHGLNDFNVKPRHAARLWAALASHKVPAKIWWNQGGHGDRANTARQAVWRDTLNRFWSHYLFGVDNGAMSGPKVVIEREDNTWVEYADWPVPGSAPVSVQIAAAADANGIGLLGLTRSRARATETIVDNAAIDATELVAAAQSPHRLVYQSPPLSARLHVSGTASVKMRVAIDKPAAIVSAMLVDYPSAGPPVILARGWMDPQNRESLTRTTPVQPGRAYDLTVELQPHDRIFAVGSRVGLVLLSSDRLFTLRPAAGTRLTVSPSDSMFSLPVVGGESAWRAATSGQ
jgi:X-Pro dipeptidyl-peptidase